MASLDLTVPPPAVALGCAGAMTLLAWLQQGRTMPIAAPTASLRTIAATLAALGVGIALSGVLSFRRARTTVNPLKPESSSALVTSGIYRLTRNPMYLGMAVVLLGWAAWLGSPWMLLGVATFAAYITRFQIVPEERALMRLFGAAFATYRARVRRWI